MNKKIRYARDGLHFFVIHAVPSRREGQLAQVQGAFVSCWINFRLYDGALALAKFYVANEGWKIKSIDTRTWINGPANAAPKTLRYYHEAQKTGASFVFHHYKKAK